MPTEVSVNTSLSAPELFARLASDPGLSPYVYVKRLLEARQFYKAAALIWFALPQDRVRVEQLLSVAAKRAEEFDVATPSDATALGILMHLGRSFHEDLTLHLRERFQTVQRDVLDNPGKAFPLIPLATNDLLLQYLWSVGYSFWPEHVARDNRLLAQSLLLTSPRGRGSLTQLGSTSLFTFALMRELVRTEWQLSRDAVVRLVSATSLAMVQSGFASYEYARAMTFAELVRFKPDWRVSGPFSIVSEAASEAQVAQRSQLFQSLQGLFVRQSRDVEEMLEFHVPCASRNANQIGRPMANATDYALRVAVALVQGRELPQMIRDSETLLQLRRVASARSDLEPVFLALGFAWRKAHDSERSREYLRALRELHESLQSIAALSRLNPIPRGRREVGS